MDPTHWTVLIGKDDQGAVEVHILEETADGLDLLDAGDCRFGPFDTCQDIALWVTRKLSPRMHLPLR